MSELNRELKPCPCCGCEAEPAVYWRVRCSNEDCDEQTFSRYETKREAIDAWNRRADNGTR